MSYTATYSPEDNKLRLYASTRLPPEVYQRVRGAGFIWAPKQDLFVAPMWTPEREDLARELAGEIDDEDTSLIDRAEQRAERFEDYAESRTEEGEAARAVVHRLGEIMQGQPVLIGHHSEKRHRKDLQRVQDKMGKAVECWKAAEYWQARAIAAKGHASYKAEPAVRARRIKGLEADRRKQERYRDNTEQMIRAWGLVDAPTKSGDPLTEAVRYVRAIRIASVDHGDYLAEYTRPSGYTGPLSYYDALFHNALAEGGESLFTVDQVRDKAVQDHEQYRPRCQRWIDHYTLRIDYERALLTEQGGTIADRTRPELGGAVRCWAGPRGGWAWIQRVNKVSVTVLDNWGNGGANFTRTIPFDKLQGVMSAAEVAAARNAGRVVETSDRTGFLLRDPQPAAAEVAS